MMHCSQLKMRLHNHHYYLRLLIILALVAIILMVVHLFELYLPGLEKRIHDLGLPLLLVLLFCWWVQPLFLSLLIRCVLMLACYSLYCQAFCMWLYIAAAVIFILGRYFFREKVKSLVA